MVVTVLVELGVSRIASNTVEGVAVSKLPDCVYLLLAIGTIYQLLLVSGLLRLFLGRAD